MPHNITLKELGKVDPYIANSRLAYHLLQLKKQYQDAPIGILADKALKGQWAHEGSDVFKHLGNALKASGHVLSKAYNFDRMHDALTLDKEVGDYVKNIVKNNQGNKLYRRVAETFAPLTAKDLKGNDIAKHKDHDSFWQGLQEHISNKLGAGSLMSLPASALSADKLHRSLRRLAYKEDDAEDFGKKQRVSKGDNLTWQDNLKQLPDKKSVEAYKREDDLLKYMSDCNNVVAEFIEEMRDKGLDMKAIKEALLHEFHMDNGEASKAMITYALPQSKYNEEYAKQLS